MDIFDWVQDIEETYKFLIEKAKEENLADIQKFKAQEEKLIDFKIKKKRNFVDSNLKLLLEEVNNGMEKLTVFYNQSIENIQVKYEENRLKIINSIIKQLGFEF
jgi:phosphoribosylanthranilate isomerase